MASEFIKTTFQGKAFDLFTTFRRETRFRDFETWSKARQNELVVYTRRFTESFGIDIEKDTARRIVEAIEMNRIMALLLSTKEYENIVDSEKYLKGKDTTLAESVCIDGRIPTIHRDGRVIKVHETMAGLLDVEYSTGSSSQGKPLLKDKRLVAAIEDEAKRGPLLEILVAHGDLQHPDHGCGAMGQIQAANLGRYPKGTDMIQANLDLHQEAAVAIDLTYNDAAAIYEKPKQDKTAITAVYDTRTMGIVLGYNSQQTLYTTDIVHTMIEQPELYIGPHVSSSLQSGSLEHEILKPEALVSNAKLLLELTKKLLDENNPFRTQVDIYIDEKNPELKPLSEKQKQALRFYLARTTAFQYLTKSYEGKHRFVDHDEKIQSISSDGVGFGQFLPDQVFAASPNSDEVVKHIITQCNLMNQKAEQVKPYLLFVSSALSESQITEDSGARERSKGTNTSLLSLILHNPEILERIKMGELIVIPVSIHDKNRDVIAINNGLGAF